MLVLLAELPGEAQEPTQRGPFEAVLELLLPRGHRPPQRERRPAPPASPRAAPRPRGPPSRPSSNSSAREDIAHPSESGARPGPFPRAESNSRGSTPKARASFLTVPKCGREILPLSIPETVIGLIPASSARRPCVHIRTSRNSTTLLCTSLLSITPSLAFSSQ